MASAPMINQGGLPPYQHQMPQTYDPLNVGPNFNMAAKTGNMNSNIKRAVSDNVQFYTQDHFVKPNNQNNMPISGFPSHQ